MNTTWSRLGYLGLMIPLAMWAVGSAVWGAGNPAAMRGTMLAAAGLVWGLGSLLNAGARRFGDVPPHRILGLPMQWSAALPLGAALITFA